MTRATLPLLVQELLHPAAYPHPVAEVQLLQTHISYVFLAGEYAYKVKKPVNFGFVDFSTLAKRRYYCRQEVLLNRRLCSDVYLGVVRIRERRGRIAVEGPGRVVEYAVQMRRLPAERMLDRLIASPQALFSHRDRDLVRRVAERLAAFHANAETNPQIAAYGDRAIRYSWEENFQQWASFIGDTITAEQDQVLRVYGDTFFARCRDVLQRRVQELRIRDCHGDLRSDAICFVDGVCIFDCLEFNRRLRYTDVAGDVGFLAMDLEYRGRQDLAEAFVQHYVEVSGDTDLRAIIEFYKCYRACVRGKVESLRSADVHIEPREWRAARKAARRYFQLACRYAVSLPPAFLIITCGLPATGKSSLARRLAERAGVTVLSSDVVRKGLAGLGPGERRFEPFRRGIYAPAFTDRTYRALLDAARPLLAAGQTVVLDASFAQQKHRRWAMRLAAETGAQFLCVECRATDTVIAERLAHRLREGRDPSDARWDIYLAQKRAFQPVTELPAERHVVVNTERPLEKGVQVVTAALRRIWPLWSDMAKGRE